MDIYARSFGSIESERAENTFSVPPDYNGSLYRETPKPTTPSEPIANEIPPPKKEEPLLRNSSSPEKDVPVFRSVLEKISAEDLILFVLILSVLFGDTDENGTVLAVILAILLT